MSIKTMTVEEIRHLKNSEGLVLQGCGGSLTEWVDGINDLLTQSGILQEGSKFHDCITFENEGVTCLLFPFSEDTKLDMGKLAIWRLTTYESLGGTWLSDYVPNQLGGFISENEIERVKPDCPLIGQDGNIFNLIGIAARTLRNNDMKAEAKEMSSRVMSAGSYEDALQIIGEYVNITSSDDIDIESESYDEGMCLQ